MLPEFFSRPYLKSIGLLEDIDTVTGLPEIQNQTPRVLFKITRTVITVDNKVRIQYNLLKYLQHYFLNN